MNYSYPFLKRIFEPIAVSQMSPELTKEVQELLAVGGFYVFEIDGIPGEKTQDAFAKFKTSRKLNHLDRLGQTTAQALLAFAPTEPFKYKKAKPQINEP